MISILLLTLFIVTINAKEEVLQMSSVFRHGARNSLNLEYLSPEDQILNKQQGELTAVGMRQHYNLGNQMKKKYIDDLQLLDSHYDPEQIRIRTTDVNRTIISVLSQLQGMFPLNGPMLPKVKKDLLLPPYQNIKESLPNTKSALPNNLQLIPSHTLPESQDYLLLSYDRRTCPINNIYIQQQMETDLYKSVDKNSSFVYDWVEKQFNIKFTPENRTLNALAWVWGNKNVLEYQGRPFYLPSTDKVYKQLLFLFNWSYYYTHYGTEQQLKLENSNFFSEIVENMNDTIHQKPQRKVYLYSAHDTTVMFVIRALNLTSPQCHYDKQTNQKTKYKYCFDYPTFASNVQFELVRKEKEYYVRVIYNGQVVKVCNNQSVELCPFNDFVVQIRNKYHLDNFEDVCLNKGQVDTPKNYKSAFIGITVAFVIVFILLAFALIKLYNIKKYSKVQEVLYQTQKDDNKCQDL